MRHKFRAKSCTRLVHENFLKPVIPVGALLPFNSGEFGNPGSKTLEFFAQ
jgi:hypothetical protein